MNQKNSLINLLLVSTAALSGYRKGAAAQYKYDAYRSETQTYTGTNTSTNATNMNTTSNNTNTAATTNANPSSNSNPTTCMNYTTYTMPSNTPTGSNPSATDAAQADNIFLPAFLAALYAADEAVNLNPESSGPFQLHPLEYDYDALEPYIGEETLRIHHNSLHHNYVDNLNNALYPEFYSYTLLELLLFHDRFPSDIQSQIIHNAGGHYNHALTWKLIGPGRSNQPSGDFAKAVDKQFGSFENLKLILTEAAMSVKGTGYAWLALNPYGRMIVVTTEEQLTPIPLRTVPLLPIDVWEHAHYLDYGENRNQYIGNYLELVDWDRVGARFTAANDILMNCQ